MKKYIVTKFFKSGDSTIEQYCPCIFRKYEDAKKHILEEIDACDRPLDDTEVITDADTQEIIEAYVILGTDCFIQWNVFIV